VNDDVPIIVETLSRPFFPMVRCFYIAIEFDTPDNQWTLGLHGQRFPFLLLGLTGIVQAPLKESRFRNPLLIDGFIEGIERAGGTGQLRGYLDASRSLLDRRCSW
jgi:hypothetical protein